MPRSNTALDTSGRKYYALINKGKGTRRKNIPSVERLALLHKRQDRQARRNRLRSSQYEHGKAVHSEATTRQFVVDRHAIDRHVKIGTFAGIKGKLSERALVKRALLSWRRLTGGATGEIKTFVVDYTSQPELAAQRSRLAGGRKGYTAVDHLDRPVSDQAWRDFQFIESSAQHCQVVDEFGNVLAYRYRLPKHLVDLLQAASDELGVKKPSIKSGQGAFPVRYYTVWKRQLLLPRFSLDYLEHRREADRFLARIAPLLKRLSLDLRFIAPQVYVRYSKLSEKLASVGLRSLAGVWPGLNLNQSQTADQGVSVHKDFLDLPSGMNAVIPFGSWEDGHVVLWQVYKVIELLPGDVLFFNGSNLIHSGTPITGGVRNSLNLFGHQEVFEFFEDLAWTGHLKAALHRMRDWENAVKEERNQKSVNPALQRSLDKCR